MKTSIRTQTKLPGALLVAALLSAGTAARADVISQTVNQTGAAANGWAAAIWGTPAALPTAGNSYVTPDTFAVRTPNNANPVAFAGDNLSIDPGGILYLKHTGGAAAVNLILNGGRITYHGGPTADSSPLSGAISVLADSLLTTDQGSPNNRDIALRSSISGSGNLTVAMTSSGAANAVILSGDNSAFTGNWNCTGGFIQIGSGAINALGSGKVTLVNTVNGLIFNATNDLVITNVIDGPGIVSKLNTNTVTLDGSNPFYGTLIVNGGVLKVANASAIANVYIISLGGGTLDVDAIGGLQLNDSLGQILNSRGTITSGLSASSGNTLNFNLSAATNDVLNISGPLTLNGTPTLNLLLPGFKPSGTYRLINYTGTIQGGGSFNLVPPEGSSETFQLDTSIPGQVNLIVTGDSQNLTWVGDGSGNTWDLSSPNWTGDANVFSLGDNVTFDDSGSAAPDIYVPAAIAPGKMTINNTAQSYLFYGEGISTADLLTKAGTNILIFTNPGNNFSGPVDIQDGVLSIGGGGNFGSFGNPSAITNNGILRVHLASGGQSFSGPISGSGSLEVTGGGGNLGLSGTNSYTGLTTIDNECQLNIASSSALGSAETGTIVLANGRLGVNTFVGVMTVDEPLTVRGFGITPAPGALYVNTPNNDVTWAGPVTLGGDTRFRVVNSNVRMNFSSTVIGDNVALQCTVGSADVDVTSAIRFQNTLSLGNGGSLIKDGQGAVILEGSVNSWGSTIVNGGTLLVNSELNGGTITINTGAALGGTGTVLGPVSVADGGSIAPGASGTGTLTLNNSLSLAAASVVQMELNRTSAPNADRLVAATLPLDGILTVTNLGPALQLGDSFDLLDGSISGTFSAVNLPALTAGLVWDTSLLASQGIIKVAQSTVPILPLVIRTIERQPGSVTLTWDSNTGRVYTVEYSLDLLHWTPLQTDISAAAGTNTTAILDTTGAGGGLNVTLAQYQMGTTNAQIQDANNLVAAGSLTPGLGLSLFNANASTTPNYASAPVLQITAVNTGTDLATAFANQAWLTFTLTVGSSITDLDLTSLTFNGARGGGATPRGYGVYVTTPSTTDEAIQGATDFATQRPSWSQQTVNLSGFSSLQNLTSGQTVTFKIPFYSPAPASSVEFDDITVIGNLSPAPLPPYAGASQLFLRVKEQ